MISKRRFIDADGKQKSVYRMDSKDSVISSYVEKGKVVNSFEYYNTPKEVHIGDKVYKNVFSKVSKPGKPDIYTIVKPNGYINEIGVLNNKVISDMNKSGLVSAGKKVAKCIKTAAAFLSNLMVLH